MQATCFFLLIPIPFRHICKTCYTIEMFLKSQHNVMYWPEEDRCHELHHGQKMVQSAEYLAAMFHCLENMICTSVLMARGVQNWIKNINIPSRKPEIESDSNVANLIKGWQGVADVAWIIWWDLWLGQERDLHPTLLKAFF